MLVQFGIHKGILYQRLTIVKHTIHLDSGDVLTQCGKLALLDRTYLALGIQHVHVNTLNTQESVGHSRTGIATGSNEYVHLLMT